MPTGQPITPCLWFDKQAEDAARFYAGIFKNSKIGKISRYGEAGREVHGQAPGTVMTVDFELDGQRITALNGGPLFKFNEAVSLQVFCEDQKEIDYFWDKLSKGGDPNAQACGWVKDKFGLSWQVVPATMRTFFEDSDSAGARRAMEAMLHMKKIDVGALERAYQGETVKA